MDSRLPLAVLGGAAASALACPACSQRAPITANRPLSRTLTVLVRPPDRTVEPVPVSDPGALPVQSSGAMTIDVELDEPAFIYLVWIDAEGRILPLYPWNNETLEIKDLSAPPPLRRATKRIF